MEIGLTNDTIPEGQWTFDEDVTTVFDNMLARSIPQYPTMRELVLTIAVSFATSVPKPTVLVDLGCSRGESIAALRVALGSDAFFVGIDSSEPMLAAARIRFRGCDNVRIDHLDLRSGYPEAQASVTLVVLTLQFVPLEHRQRVVHNIFIHTRPGGAFVLVEKVLGASSGINATMVETYEAMKARNGYTSEQIDRKRVSLEGVLVPLTAAWNEDLLRQAGFHYIDCFWRWMNFAGWIAVRPD
jgi:tRNA (cmo5U34)-methyltransferase